MTAPFAPILVVDVGGSVLMIVFSFLCLGLVRRLRRRDPHNVVWTYLFWVCLALAGFAVSRSAGHILKQALVLTNHKETWSGIRPFSGAINTFMFVFVASATLFFERVWKVYEQIAADKTALQQAHAELLHLNQNLEGIVLERSKALAISERQYRRIFEVSPDMILVVDSQGRIVDINPAGCRELGFGEPDASPKGERFQVFFEHDDWQQLQAAIERDGFVTNSEITLRRLDGAAMRSLVSASLVVEPSEKDYTIHFQVRDIERRHMIREQMAQADRLASIGQLSSGIAHEINNPLGVILGYAQLMLRNEPESSDRRRDLKTIEKHVRHCKTIVEDLLNFARRSEPKKENVDIHKTIDDVLGFIRQHSGSNRIDFMTDYDRRMPAMVLDEKKIKQVLINLLMNARHAVGDAGQIRVTTAYSPASRQATIRVVDNGYGIEARHLQHIFDPFFTTKPTGEGTGLGLSVSYGIVKKHGGEILVESKPGAGSTFTVVLPVLETN
ncbi:MAG TPA: ATP-binding protein [Desulfobacterales bacterium]|nr:ATP-binding protein [Desulfobacterales bacterium]